MACHPPKPGSRLQALLDSKVAYLSEYGNYLAVASDGVEIALCGPLMNKSEVDSIERYLADRPSPKDW